MTDFRERELEQKHLDFKGAIKCHIFQLKVEYYQMNNRITG